MCRSSDTTETLQASIVQETKTALTMRDLFNGQPMHINVAVQYVKPKQVPYVKETLQALVRTVIDEPDLDLETNPVNVSGASFYLWFQLILSDLSCSCQPGGNAVRSHQLEAQRYTVPRGGHRPGNTNRVYSTSVPYMSSTDCLLTSVVQFRPSEASCLDQGLRTSYHSVNSQDAIRYALHRAGDPFSGEGEYQQCFGGHTCDVLQQQFPNESEETYAAFLGRLIYYRYIHPAIL